ncbi:ribonuclease MC-like [Momordica charantia]|uniref:Ribonuclease MC-like n=1 Tax=Momordica charantia TaxID=3673 RepID=A0A6J1DYQ5_MOMCH|nr:ribonuclease MC-like [Momordica charantia]
MAKALFLLLVFVFMFFMGAKGYDYFLMVQQWGPNKCTGVNVTCHGTPPLPTFTIHGLWPGINNSPRPLINCPGPPFDPAQITASQRQQLDTYWPDVQNWRNQSFWQHEWETHGKCSYPNFRQTAYLEAALDIRRNHNYDLLAIIHNPTGMIHNYNAIEAAIQAATNRTPFLRCNVNAHTGRHQLFEIVLCFDRNGVTLIDCNQNNTRALHMQCPHQFVWLPRHPPSLGVAIGELKDSLIYHLSLPKLFLLTLLALSTAFAFVFRRRFFRAGSGKKD